jgi:hypothetical protein
MAIWVTLLVTLAGVFSPAAISDKLAVVFAVYAIVGVDQSNLLLAKDDYFCRNTDKNRLPI